MYRKRNCINEKILLTALNARYSHSNLALRYLRETVSDLPIEVVVMEFSINQESDAIMDMIEEVSPDILGFSVYIWNNAMTAELLQRLKDKNIPVLLGGPEVSYNQDKWFDAFSNVKWIICGPGEGAFKKLASSDFSLPGGTVAEKNIHFNEVPFPYKKEDLENLQHRYVYYESSRGCPFRCSYCLSSRRDQRLQLRDINKVNEELSFLVRNNAGTIKFVDRSFNADHQFSRAVWGYCIENFSPDDARFHFEVFPSLLEEDDFHLLKKAPEGLFQFEIGIQSIHAETLGEISRPEKWDEVRKKILRLMEAENIHIHVDLIAGLPFEGYNHIRDSFNAIYDLGADHLQLGFLKVLPGTEVAEKSAAYGIEHETGAPYTIIKNKWLSMKEVKALQEIARLLDIYKNSHKFSCTAEEIISRFENPFSAFESLANFNAAETITDTSGASWEKRADFLLRFAAEHFSGEREFFYDTLRYDWINVTGRHRFPHILDDGTLSGQRKEILQKLTDKSSEGECTLPDTKCTMEELRRAVIYLPSTEEFRNRHLGGDEVFLFLPSKKISITFLKQSIYE